MTCLKYEFYYHFLTPCFGFLGFLTKRRDESRPVPLPTHVPAILSNPVDLAASDSEVSLADPELRQTGSKDTYQGQTVNPEPEQRQTNDRGPPAQRKKYRCRESTCSSLTFTSFRQLRKGGLLLNE
jgi:hypothetical protein